VTLDGTGRLVLEEYKKPEAEEVETAAAAAE
jgi:hypothetical protein